MKIRSLSKRSVVIVMSSLLLTLLLADFSTSIIAKSPPLQAGIEPPQFMSHGESATLQEDGHITGTVTDSNGNALPGIHVNVYQYHYDELGGYWELELVAYANTNDDGTYDVGGLTTGTYYVGFSGNNYIPESYDNASDIEHGTDVSVTAGNTTSGIDASLSDGGHITGTVTDSSGNPLPNINVYAYQYNPSSGDWDSEASADTTSDGTYDVSTLNTGTYRVAFSDNSHKYIPEYYDNASDIENATDISVTAGETTSSINASLSESGHITGTVTDSDGNALPSITVNVYQYNPESGGSSYVAFDYTNRDGTYDVAGLNTGTYRVRFSSSDNNYILEYYSDAATIENATDISVSVGNTTSGIDASLSEGGHITGTVSDNHGNPLPDISVGVYQYFPEWGGSSYVASADTNSDGTYDVGTLNTGTYRVHFSDYYNNYLAEYYDNAATILDGTDVSVTVDETTSGINASLSDGGHITGTVTDNDGNPLPDIDVEVYQYNPESGGWESGASANSNSDGTYEVQGLNTGTYRVGFSDYYNNYLAEYYDNAPDLESADDVSVTVDETTSGINASLSDGGHITGTVTDSDGNPLPDITVNVYQYNSEWDSWGYVASARTNSDGTYDVNGLNTGTYRVGFSDYNYLAEYYDNAPDLESADDVSVTVDDTTSGIDASLSKAGHITGTATDSDGNPLPYITVEVYQYYPEWGGWDNVALAYTTSDGTYDVAGLNPGTYRVGFSRYSNYISEYYFDAPTFESATDVLVTVGETTSGIDASLSQGGHLRGIVTDSDGNPLPNINVEVYQYFPVQDDWKLVTSTQTEQYGIYDVLGLNTGTYRVGFFDYYYGYLSEYYLNAPDLESATDIEVTVDETTSGIDASLSEGGHITGTVTDSDGNPLQKITVDVYQYNPSSRDWDSVASAYTSSDGTYDIAGLNTGTYRVGFFDYYYGNLSEYYDNAPDLESALEVSVTVGNTTSGIDASLSEGGHITGTVTDNDGNALSDVGVGVYQYNLVSGDWDSVVSVYTNSDGTYDIAGLNTGTYRVHFNANDNDHISEYYDNAATILDGTDLSVTAGETTSGIDASLSQGGHITGTVVYGDGNLFPEIVVNVYQYNSESASWQSMLSTETNGNGTYDVGGLNTGTYRVGFVDDYFDHYDYFSEYYSDTLTILDATDVSVTVSETTRGIDASLNQTGHITGTVTDSDGNALSDIYVGVYQYNEFYEKWESIRASYTNSDGTYDVQGLNTGSYRLRFFDLNGNYLPKYYLDAPNVNSATNIEITVEQSVAKIDISLDEAGHIKGTVTDIEGKPLPDSYVGVYQYQQERERWQRVSYAYSKTDGTYDVGSLNTGSYRLRFYHRRHISEYYDNTHDLQSATELNVTAGESINGIDASLEEKKKFFLPLLSKQ